MKNLTWDPDLELTHFSLWTQGYENAAVTIDELPPPFTEEESKSDKMNNTSPETSIVDTTRTVIVIPTTNEDPNCSSA